MHQKLTNNTPLTPASVTALGYTPIAVYPDTRAIARRWAPGLDIDIAAGIQADGTSLYVLDLDSHRDDQDAAGQLARILARVGRELAARLAIRVSRSGTGYHIVYRTSTPHSPHAAVKMYDPHQPDRHIGELIGPGGRATLTGTWLQAGPEAIPLLTASELDLLRAAIHTPTLYVPQDAPSSPTARKDRMAEGLNLITGWEHVRDPQGQLDRLAARSTQLAQRLLALRRTPQDRSAAYCEVVQSLMLHAGGLGTGIPDRCRTVAALAIHVGAAGKERERTYKIVQDTAVLIARILHGDAFLNAPELHFAVPRWASADQLPPPPAATTRAQAAPRTPGRLATDRQRQIKRLLRTLRQTAPDAFGRRHIQINDLATELRVSRRTLQTYLAELRTTGAIRSGQEGGNGALYIMLLDPPKPARTSHRHARSVADEPQAPADTYADRGAEPAPESRSTTPDNVPQAILCTEVLGAPKPCAPAPAPAPAVDQADDLAVQIAPVLDDQADDLAVQIAPALDDQAASYDPAADQIAAAADAPGRGRRARKDPVRRKLDDQRRRLERWRAMPLPDLERERSKLAGASRDTRRSATQRQVFTDMLPALDHELGRKRAAGIQAMYAAAGPGAGGDLGGAAGAQAGPVAESPPAVPGVTRRVWRSPVVQCDWEPVPFAPHPLAVVTHPGAALGDDPAVSAAAHAAYTALRARYGLAESGGTGGD
jgi:hypothetical protein